MKQLCFLILSLTLSVISIQAQVPDQAFFDKVDSFLKKYVDNGKVAYGAVQKGNDLQPLIKEIENTSLEGQSEAIQQAFYINAYNLLVIKGVTNVFPLESVLDVNGFFDSKKHKVAGEMLTLNDLEKKRLLRTFEDPRFHFVLVCGAVGCPPIIPSAYRPEKLEEQLEQQTRLALNDEEFVRVNNDKKEVKLSQIFEWYPSDFGGSKSSSLAYINQYRTQKIPESFSIGFYTYNWSLNGTAGINPVTPSESNPTINNIDEPIANNSIRYVVSATIPKGTTETKIFNNLYTQITGNGSEHTNRSTFFTAFITSLYGLTNRFNAGLEVRYRSVLNDGFPASPFSVFGGGEMQDFRHGIATIGPKIRWAPVPKWGNFSVQSAFWIPIIDELEGGNDSPFLDWNKPTWWTQIFNDFPLGNSFSLFTEIDFMWEDMGQADDAFNRISTPATVILSYFPTPPTTLYVINGFSPFWSPELDYFYQVGVGAKHQITRQFELELLYTYFTNQSLQDNNGRASTLNFGIRVNK